MKSQRKRPAPLRSVSSERAIGKISRHTKGLGTVTRRMVKKRAEELALIAGRTRDQVSPSDYRQAKSELLRFRKQGGTQNLDPAVQPWDPAPASRGRRRRKSLPQDDRNTETLVKEGVEEAVHDEMITNREVSEKKRAA